MIGTLCATRRTSCGALPHACSCLLLASNWMLSRSPCEVRVPCVASGLSLREFARGEQVWQGSCVPRAESRAVRSSSGASSIPQFTCLLVNRV